MKRYIVTLMVSFLLAPAVGAVGDAGIESPFSFGAGARELALGGADLAGATPSFAVYWNPAALTNAERYSISGFHTRLFESGMNYQFLGFVAPTTDIGTFGVGFFHLGIGDIQRRDVSNFVLDTISEQRISVRLAYARKFSGFSVGVAITGEKHSLDTYGTTSSPGIDLAISKHIRPTQGLISELAIALVGRNLIRPSFPIPGGTFYYPYQADFGASITLVPGVNKMHSVSSYIKLSKIDNLKVKFSAGLEYRYKDLLSLRTGIRESKPAAGIGLKYGSFSFDYAIVDRDLGSLHVLNIGTFFGGTLTSRRLAREAKREIEFNNLMQQRLHSKNQSLVEQLVADGTQSLDSKNLELAANEFDRALFIARNSNYDTSSIIQMLRETRELLELERTSRDLNRYLDSALARLNADDYLFAMYFANLALENDSASEEAKLALSAAKKSIQSSESSEILIRVHIAEADSLITYGEIKKAIEIIERLRQLSPSDPRVVNTYSRAQFERLRSEAQRAYERNQPRRTLATLDSALNYFPNHAWCVQLRHKVLKEALEPVMSEYQVERESIKLSPGLAREVTTRYERGRILFAESDLKGAIVEWETVSKLDQNFKSIREYLVKAYKFSGIELYGDGKLDAAILVWKKAAAIDNKNTKISNYITRAESEREQLDRLSNGL